MNKYKILTLTDHAVHTKENSVYAILRAMSMDERCARLDVASRGNKENDSFFRELSTSRLKAITAREDFSFDPTGAVFERNTMEVDLHDYDIIFLRLPRPISDGFLFGLEEMGRGKVIINRPSGIIISSNKSYLLHFPELCPPIALCKSVEEVLAFSKRHDLVLKPLREYGGKGIVKISGNTLNDGIRDWDTKAYLEERRDQVRKDGYLAMKYLKNVNQGDKRLLVVNGKILGASLRLPPRGSWLCNVSRGGSAMYSKPTAREVDIVERISPGLKKLGILIYGVDTLVDDNNERILSEINTLSIGGFMQAEQQSGKPVIQPTVQNIIKYADIQYGT